MKVSLRALEPEDLSILYLIENDEQAWECSANRSPISRYALKHYIESCKNDIFLDGQLRLVIEADGEAAGLLDLFDYNPFHNRAEVGIFVLEDFRHQGVGEKALEWINDYARRFLGLHQLYAHVSEANHSAKSLFLRAGYQQTTVLAEWLFTPSGDTQDVCFFQCFLKK